MEVKLEKTLVCSGLAKMGDCAGGWRGEDRAGRPEGKAESPGC
jgi:hypothetical protein